MVFRGLLLAPVIRARDLRITSPNGRIIFTFKLTKTAPTYRVTFDSEPLVNDLELSLVFRENGAEPLPQGYHSSGRRSGAKRQINPVVHVFDDGVQAMDT